jgi:CheY-like chemotaxis protein
MSVLADARTVLLCDDQSELRDAIVLLLANFPRFRVVGQAIDGVSCLRRIADSRPDIVIMDVSLPGGGAELVRGARAGHPNMHIVMFSGHDEASMQADMLAAGADCYVIKTGRLKPLIEAMDSPSAARSEPASREVPAIGRRHSAGGDRHGVAAGRHGHEVFCYRDDAELVPHLTATATTALADGGRLVVVATGEHRAALRAALPAGIVNRATADGRFIDLDADQALAGFMRRGLPDPVLFDRTIGAIIRAQASAPGALHAWGEMVSLLWEQGNLVGTLRLEQLWTELQRRVAFDLVCGYRIADQSGATRGGFAAIGDLHPKLAGDGGLGLDRGRESRRVG